MHAWFYSPSRLPQTYNAWISAAADVDDRLVLALRHARYGTWIYGKDTGMAPLLGSMCHDYGLPVVQGDPAQTIPIPCELVHMGRGKSCEKHALLRFWGGFTFAAKMYAPIQLFILTRHLKQNSRPENKLSGLTLSAMAKSLFVGDYVVVELSSALGQLCVSYLQCRCRALSAFPLVQIWSYELHLSVS